MNQERVQKLPAGSLHYRVATTEDAALLQRLVQDSFRHPGTSFGDTSGVMTQFRVPLDRMLDKITQPDSEVIIVTEPSSGAAEEGTIVACYQLKRKTAGLTRFAMFAVDARHQGRGLARPILRHAEDRGRRTWGATTMQLNTLSSRGGLLAWYRRCGYRETGVWEEVPSSMGGAEGLDGLHFVVMEKELEAAAS